jgi:hypothetical protein
MLSQLLAAADSAGLGPSLYTRFADAAVGALVGADGVHEWPVAVVTLGDGAPALEPGGDAVAGAVDAAPPLEFPLVTLAQRAGDGDVLGEPWPQPAPLNEAPPRSADLDAVILQRGSTRILDPAASVPVTSCGGRWPSRCAARACRTTWRCTPWRGSSRVCTAGRISSGRGAAGSCARSSSLSAWSRSWAATRRSS